MKRPAILYEDISFAFMGHRSYTPMTLHPYLSMATRTEQPDDSKKALQLRLRKMMGQIRSIETMIEQDMSAQEILTQAISVRKALKSFTEVVIQEHAASCVEGSPNPKEAQRKLRDLLLVLKRYVE